MRSIVFFTKWICHHCGNTCKRHVEYLIDFIPASVVCMKCGKKLKGCRRVSTANGKTKVWVEYR